MHYTKTNSMIANDFSYNPLPFFDDMVESENSLMTYSRKLDLNLYCIKHPQQTCFIRVTNPDMIAWNLLYTVMENLFFLHSALKQRISRRMILPN